MSLPHLYILAGGRNSRFGSDKARAIVHGQPMILRIARGLAPCTAGVTVVARERGQYADLGLRTIADHEPGLGPMSGLQAALHDPTTEAAWIVLTSCDLVTVDPAIMAPLLSARTAAARAVAYRHQRWEPLPALYRGDLRVEVDRRLAARELAMHRLLDDLDAIAVMPPADQPLIVQANTPEQLAQYLRNAS